MLPKAPLRKRIKPKARKDKKHLAFVAQQPCCVTGRWPVVVHHLMERFPDKIGRRDDKYAIPIVPEYHNHARGVHGPETEKGFLSTRGIDGEAVALRLWEESHV